jgi:hypothetical protein
VKSYIVKKQSGDVKFPCLMEGRGGFIVFMWAEECGVVISSNPKHPIGDLCIGGSLRWNMTDFEPFFGSVTIESD